MKRQRGRGRKPSNPSNRSYESNGPDVKIRGNANQIYDKYLQYARDAQTSGDRIAAEAYFQHAEHYFRIMAANQPKERPMSNDEQDGRDEDDRQNENSSNNSKSSRDSQSADGSDAMEVVDGNGEQPEDISANETSDASDEEKKPAPRRRTRRRRPTEEANSSSEASEDASDDAGLRAMMARSATDDVADGSVETVES